MEINVMKGFHVMMYVIFFFLMVYTFLYQKATHKFRQAIFSIEGTDRYFFC